MAFEACRRLPEGSTIISMHSWLAATVHPSPISTSAYGCLLFLVRWTPPSPGGRFDTMKTGHTPTGMCRGLGSAATEADTPQMGDRSRCAWTLIAAATAVSSEKSTWPVLSTSATRSMSMLDLLGSRPGEDRRIGRERE